MLFVELPSLHKWALSFFLSFLSLEPGLLLPFFLFVFCAHPPVILEKQLPTLFENKQIFRRLQKRGQTWHAEVYGLVFHLLSVSGKIGEKKGKKSNAARKGKTFLCRRNLGDIPRHLAAGDVNTRRQTGLVFSGALIYFYVLREMFCLSYFFP